jgi:tRNA (mo5U34)-methyltransferase
MNSDAISANELRHPLPPLDLIREPAAGDLPVFQPMPRGSTAVEPVAEVSDCRDRDRFERRGSLRLHVVGRAYAHGWANWWIPNRVAIEAMPRASGFAIESRPDVEIYLCRRAPPL